MFLTLLMGSCSSDETFSRTKERENVTVDLALNISTRRESTRMTNAITQQSGETFRGIQDQRLFPFAVTDLSDGRVAWGMTPLSDYITDLQRFDATNEANLNYFDDRSVTVPEGTAAFLCYCRAVPAASVTVADGKFANGVVVSNLGETALTTSDIRFAPEVIYQEKVGDQVKVEAKATAIADYLTAIANAEITVNVSGVEQQLRWSVLGQSEAEQFVALARFRELFRQFVNDGHVIACSSASVLGRVNWLLQQLDVLSPAPVVDSDEAHMREAILAVATASEHVAYDDGQHRVTALNEAMTGYPANILMPDGAAVVQWNYTERKFEPRPQTTTQASINSLDRFVYPAELCYYANSRIKTSTASKKPYYAQSDWADVLSEYETNNGIVETSTQSVALIDPLTYAVGCLQVGMVVNTTLADAKGALLTLSDEKSLPLSAIMVSSQHPQSYRFEPVENTLEEYVAYDREIEKDGITMNGAKNSDLTAAPTQYFNTLVLQTQEGKAVRFALEFTNNSEQDFEGLDGTVHQGTKFYLVGTIQVPDVQDQDYKRRVFTKNYITQGKVVIASLKEAYTYLPDLLDPRLEVGIQLIPSWIQSTPRNVPL